MEVSEYLVFRQCTFHSPDEYSSIEIIAGKHCATHRKEARFSLIADRFDEHHIAKMRVFIGEKFLKKTALI